MKATGNAISLIKQFEGKELRSYQDAKGKWAIGYGQTGRHIGPGLVITDKEAEDMLKAHVARLEDDISDLVNVPLKQEQFDALVSFVYNVGIGAFSTSTLLRLLNQGHKDMAADELLKWVHADGQELAGLRSRRFAEYQLFRS